MTTTTSLQQAHDTLATAAETAKRAEVRTRLTKTAIDSGLVGRLTGNGAPTMVADGSFAYRTARRIDCE